jgi:cation transport regulator ChaC
MNSASQGASNQGHRNDSAPDKMEQHGQTWYFAYGSNLSRQRMAERTGAIPQARPACLKDYRLAFNCRVGASVYANIVPSAGSLVWGVVYLCDFRAMIELDLYEGVAHGCYRRSWVEIETENADRLMAQTYLAGEKHVALDGKPNATYLDLIVTGAKDHGLSEQYIRCIEALARPHAT